MIRLRADTVDNIERELAKLNDQGGALAAEIERLTTLEDEPEDTAEQLAAIAATRIARNRLKKLDAKIAEARERLAAAKTAARSKLRRELLAHFGPLARDFHVKARAAQAALRQVVAAREALQAHGFREEYNGLPVPPSINGAALLAQDLLDTFEGALEPAHLAASTAPRPLLAAPGAAPRTMMPRPKVSDLPPMPSSHVRAILPRGQSPDPGKVPSAHIRVSTDDWINPPAPRQPRAPLREVAAEGERLVVMVRGGAEHPRNHQQLETSDVLALSPEEADPLVKNGAADFITPAASAALHEMAVQNGLASATTVEVAE